MHLYSRELIRKKREQTNEKDGEKQKTVIVCAETKGSQVVAATAASLPECLESPSGSSLGSREALGVAQPTITQTQGEQ